MSPNINSFVGDLVAMAKAMEDLPIAQARVQELEANLNNAEQRVQNREIAIHDYKSEIETLQAKLREAEVAKDQAETMFLEQADLVSLSVQNGKVIKEMIESWMIKIDPPRAEPTPASTVGTQADTDQSSGQSADPLPENVIGQDAVASATTTSQSVADAKDYHTAQGQSADPFSVPKQEDFVSSSPVLPTETVIGSIPTNSSPYFGKRYYDHPTYVPFTDWLAGGGTGADYNWRPAPPTTANTSF